METENNAQAVEVTLEGYICHPVMRLSESFALPLVLCLMGDFKLNEPPS